MAKKRIFALFAATIALLLSSVSYSATYNGLVTDSVTGEPLPFIAIQIANTLYGDETDIDGKFSIHAEPTDELIFNFLGYKKKTIPLKNFSENKAIGVQLVPTDFQLEEIEITAKDNYSKKNNPAVDLIRRIIAHKNENRIENNDYYQRNDYEKIVLGLTDISQKTSNALGVTDIINETDTSIISGKSVLLLSLKEQMVTEYYRKNPQAKKQIVTARNEMGIDDQLFSEGIVTTYMNEMFSNIDIYESNINIAFKPFVGPLSPIAPDFYKFFIKDTVYIDGEKCINLGFAPFNSANFGFMGFVTVSDSTLAVKRVDIDIPPSTNINYISGLNLKQIFRINEENGMMELANDELTAEMHIGNSKKRSGLYIKRDRWFSDYQYNIPNDSILREIQGNELVLRDAAAKDSTFWMAQRKDSLDLGESKMGILLNKLQKNPVVKGIMFIAELFIKGYFHTGKPSKFEIGPVYTMFSGNTIEGFRLRLGGETTAELSPRWFASGYVAVGFADQKVKYGGKLEYSFLDKVEHPREYPIHSLALSVTNDIRTMGEQPVATFSDNLFYSIKRMAIYNMEYYQQARLDYTLELRNGFSVQPWFLFERQEGTGNIYFRKNTTPYDERPTYESYDYLLHNELGIKLRYAPSEKFVQGHIYRFNIKNPHPVFELSHNASFAGLFGSQYGYQKTEFKYLQRFFFSAFARLDVLVKAGKIWTGGVPYPYLFTPNANTSFTVMEESFSQVNPLEFVTDQYASIDLNLSTNGLIFNWIPGIKKLQLREVFGFKCYWGYLSNKNNPAFNNNLLEFPENTVLLNPAEPYMEFSVGIDNIFRILRIDYVRRINYLNNPGIWANGVRVSLNFTF